MRDYPTQFATTSESNSEPEAWTSINANSTLNEIKATITSAGQTLVDINDPEDSTQMSQAMARYASGGIYGTGGGSANAQTVTAVLSFTEPTAYFDGMRVSWAPTNANTGPTTINVFGIGVVAVVTNADVALAGGEITTAGIATVVYRASLGKFVLTANGVVSGAAGGSPLADADQTITPDGTLRSAIGNNGSDLNFQVYDTTVANFTTRASVQALTAETLIDFSTGNGAGAVTGISRIALSAASATVTDTINSQGLLYAADYSAASTPRWLTDRDYVDTAVAAVAGGFQSMQAFTASGVWNRPAGITQVVIFVTGGGGGGGGSGSPLDGGCAGGGSGATSIQTLDMSGDSNATITIGAGGTGSNTTTGAAGGTTTWNDGTHTNVVAGGGAGGAGKDGVGGAGSTVHTGEALGISGGYGNSGDSENSGAGGIGGSSYWGGGGRGGQYLGAGAIGADGLAYGSGGGGGGGDAGAGGDGADGVVLVFEYL